MVRYKTYVHITTEIAQFKDFIDVLFGHYIQENAGFAIPWPRRIFAWFHGVRIGSSFTGTLEPNSIYKRIRKDMVDHFLCKGLWVSHRCRHVCDNNTLEYDA